MGRAHAYVDVCPQAPCKNCLQPFSLFVWTQPRQIVQIADVRLGLDELALQYGARHGAVLT